MNGFYSLHALKGGREIFIQEFGRWMEIMRLFQIVQKK